MRKRKRNEQSQVRNGGRNRLGWWAGLALSLSLGPAFGDEALTGPPGPRFDAAQRAFQDGFYQRAERELDALVAEFPEAEWSAQAVLLQAQARFQLGDYETTLSLLWNHLWRAGEWTDQYYFWQGEAYFEQGRYQQAAQRYGWLTRHFPKSPLFLKAAYHEALAYYKAGEAQTAMALLQEPDRPFSQAARVNPFHPLVVKGSLLLVEAQWALKDYPQALQTLQMVSNRPLNPRQAWKAAFLRTRIHLSEGAPRQALEALAALQEHAAATEAPELRGETLALKAAIHEQLHQPDEAIQAYESIIEEEPTRPYQREALLKIVELRLQRNQFPEAIAGLENFIEAHPQDPLQGLLRLTLGELRLKAYHRRQAPGQAPETAHLDQALEQFRHLVQEYPESTLIGRAHLNRGWCLWEQNRFGEAQEAFQMAVEQLADTPEGSIARFKLADIHFRNGRYDEARHHYESLIGQSPRHAALGEDDALYRAFHQSIRSDLKRGRVDEAADRLEAFLQRHQNHPYGDADILLVAQARNRDRSPEEAQNWLQRLFSLFTGSKLTPEARLALARSYVENEEWSQALEGYREWLERYQEHPLRPRVRFDQAWTYYQAGREARALELFDAFLEDYPNHSHSPKAQFWIAEHHLRNGNIEKAEIHFQTLYQNSDWPPSRIKYEARLMAGRAAVARQGYKDAIDYFSWFLTHSPPETESSQVPTDLVAKAYFALGDAFIKAPPGESGQEANDLSGFEQAINVFSGIRRNFPDHPLVPLAVARTGDCHLQLASQNPDRYPEAADSYRTAMEHELAGVTTRSQAEVGLALTLEKEATHLEDPGQQEARRENALNHYLNVLYGRNLRENEEADPFWIHKAGLEAARLAEDLGRHSQAISLYERLMDLLPSMEETFRQKLARLDGQGVDPQGE